jgi:hypothetical protein
MVRSLTRLSDVYCLENPRVQHPDLDINLPKEEKSLRAKVSRFFEILIIIFFTSFYIVVVAVKERKSNCDLNEKEVSILVAINKTRKSNCSGLTKT